MHAYRYRATTAHKACHSFESNASFQRMFHPRFGLIMSIVAKRNILPDEEILVDYHYPIASAPDWYRRQWHEYLLKKKGWSRFYVDRYGYTAHEVRSTFESLQTRLFSSKAEEGDGRINEKET